MRSFPGVDRRRWPVSAGGGEGPAWSRDGKELFFRSGEQLMAARVPLSEDFELLGIEELFTFEHRLPTHTRQYDPAPDGERVILVEDVDSGVLGGTGSHVVLVQNWFDELERSVP